MKLGLVHPALAITLALALTAPAPARAETAAEALARGEAAWARRSSGGAVDAARASEAVAAFEEAVRLDPASVEARLRLMEALWFDGHFAEPKRSQQKKMFERMTTVGEDTVRLAAGTPRLRDAHFWTGIAWGLWAMSHGNASAGFKGVAGRIRDHAEALIALDDRFADAGGLRLLGRLHAETPRVPMFTGWIDRAKGIELLRRANAISTKDPRNPLYLGQALLESAPDARDEALALLRDVAARTPDPALEVEQQELIDEARRLLKDEAPEPESKP